MSDLQIPDAAEVAIALSNPRHAIKLSVAAELRHFADGYDVALANLRVRNAMAWTGLVRERASALAEVRDQLRARADELDGGAS